MKKIDRIIAEIKFDYEDCNIEDEKIRKILTSLILRGYLDINEQTMKLLCKTCGKMRPDTNFNFKWYSLSLDTSKCQLCINPHMYDEVKEHFRKIANNQKDHE